MSTQPLSGGGTSSVIDFLKTNSGSYLYPITLTSAVYDLNGKNLEEILAGKQAVGSYALSSHNHDSVYSKLDHTHTIANISGLQNALDGKQAAGSYAAASHTHNYIASSGTIAAETGTAEISVSGISMAQVYNNGYPTTFGNVIRVRGSGQGELLLGWSGTSGAYASLYYRNQRDTSDANWSSWSEICTTGNSNPCKIQSGAPATNYLWAY